MERENRFIVKQERSVRRYNIKNLAHSLLDAFNLEHGIFFTIKEFVMRPGRSTRLYLGLGRLKFTSPFRLLILSTAVLLILLRSSSFSSGFEEGFKMGADGTATVVESDKPRVPIERVYELFSEYFNLFIWFYIPFVSLFTFLFNRKAKLNYAEHIVFNAFYTSILNFATLLLFFGYFLDSIYLSIIYSLFGMGYFVWFYKDLFYKSWFKSIWQSITITITAGILYTFFVGILIGALLASGWIPLEAAV
jgi:hypothetical protein